MTARDLLDAAGFAAFCGALYAALHLAPAFDAAVIAWRAAP